MEKVDIQPGADDKDRMKDPANNSLANLRMWKKGQSGNPGGKSKKLEEIKSLAKSKSKRALERIIELVESDDERIALMAAKEVLDRAWGRPKDSDEEGDGKNVTINILKMTNDRDNAAAQLAAPSVSVRTLALS